MMRFIFTHAAHTVTRHALEHGRPLGHSHQGGEHLLLSLAAADLPVAAVLREHGITAERVEEEIVRLEGLGPGSALFADLDTEGLASMASISVPCATGSRRLSDPTPSRRRARPPTRSLAVPPG